MPASIALTLPLKFFKAVWKLHQLISRVQVRQQLLYLVATPGTTGLWIIHSTARVIKAACTTGTGLRF